MYYILATEVTFADYIPVIVQILVTAGVIFGGTGYWQYRQSKEQAKRDEASKESGIEKKVDDLNNTVSGVDNKVEQISTDVNDLKQDLLLLQNANEETVKYREIRDKQDKEIVIIQEAVIQSLTGILRERLLENYTRCIAKGYYTKEEREVYGELYKCYTREPFSGNGVMHQLQPIMQDLPWTAEEAERRKAAKK